MSEGERIAQAQIQTLQGRKDLQARSARKQLSGLFIRALQVVVPARGKIRVFAGTGVEDPLLLDCEGCESLSFFAEYLDALLVLAAEKVEIVAGLS